MHFQSTFVHALLAITALLGTCHRGMCETGDSPGNLAREDASTPPQVRPPGKNTIDIWHERISSAVTEPIDRLDRFFADDRLDDETEKSRAVAGAGLRIDERDGFAFLTEVKLRLAMPRTEDKIQLFFDDAFSAEEPAMAADLLEAVRDSEPDTGLRFLFKRDEKRSLSLDVGTRSGTPVQLFGRLRGRMTIPLDRWELRLSQTGALFAEDGWTATSEMRLSRPMKNDFLIRSLSRATWQEDRPGVTPAQSFFLFKELSPRSGYIFTVAGVWPESPDVLEANYTTVLTYRRLIHRTWLFLEIAPGIEFPQIHDYEHNGFVSVLFEVVFGGE